MIEIFTSEDARCNHKPLHQGMADYIHHVNDAVRCMVVRGTEGCYERTLGGLDGRRQALTRNNGKVCINKKLS